MRLNRQIAVRIIADIILVNLALLLALGARFLVLFELDYLGIVEYSFSTYREILRDSLSIYVGYGWLLTAICIITFYLNGFYTYGRGYTSRYKALVILWAVGLSYLLFSFALYSFDLRPYFPRSAMIASWGMTLAIVGGARGVLDILSRAGVVRQGLEPPLRGVKRVLVVGGAGYIGSILLRKLLQAGYQVRLLDSLLYGDKAISELYGNPNFEFMRGDCRHIESVVSAMNGVDAVIHLGAIVGDPACAINGDFSVEVNTLATRMMAEVAKGYGIQRFIFASSCSVYGASDEILNEMSGLNPVSLYAKTKIDCEKLLLSLTSERLCPTILRFATIYGLSYRPRFDLVVNLLVAKAFRDRQITVFGGEQWRPFVHVEDAARAIIMCIEAPLDKVKGQVFNVGSEEQNYRIREIGEAIKRAIPEASVVTASDDKDQRNYRVSFDKIKVRLNFVAKKTLEDGIAEIKEAFESGKIKDYRDKAYSNYAYLSGENELEVFGLSRMLSLSHGEMPTESKS